MVINGIGKVNGPGVSIPDRISRDNGFREILSDKLARTEGPPRKHLHAAGTEVLEKGDRLLDLLDEYAGDLADPGKTLREMGSLVDRLEKDIRSFESEARENAAGNRELQTLVDDVAVTANVALLKFHRGDYV